MDLNTQIAALNKVGKTTAIRLKKLGLNTISDLIFYFPFRYEDYSEIRLIKDLFATENVTIKVKVQMIANRRLRQRRKSLTEALVGDETGELKVIWFNQPFIAKNIKVGDELFLSGKYDGEKVQMVGPEYEKCDTNLKMDTNDTSRLRSKPTANGHTNTIHTARILPVYHLTEGVTQKQMRFLLSQCKRVMESVEDYLPEEIKSKNKFLELNKALLNIHFPESSDLAGQAEKRLKFDELFLIQLAIAKMKSDLKSNKSFKLAFLEKQTKEFVDSLPFTLTDAQKKCAWDIIQDLEKEKPMNRMLEGDVGSGKTVVVAVAMINVILNGYKAVLMAPTEILATQHYQGLQKLYSKQKLDICLMTGSKREVNGEKISKKDLLGKLEKGELDVIIGTHAVIQDNVEIKDLGLVVVDEQHRFGVKQRKALIEKDKEKNLIPHFLSMTATPIPRSLVLTLYGDLDLSIINQMPPGRKSIITKVVYEQQRLKAYDFIRSQIKEGRQIFVICPLIDPSDKLGVKSVKQEHERLDKQTFPDLNIGLMHGRLKGKEKEEVMTDFYNKKYDILVSTSVIEVGIDVPNATIMMIEGADRFGLAQLHQFRGRVGRGEFQSYCFLFSDNNSLQTRKRLKFMESCTDGFQLAEKDLELRGAGEVYGTRQSGLPDLKIAKLTDVEIIQLAQIESQRLIENGLVTPELEEKLRGTRVSFHYE
ncbi:ATP-dependent DNA helicase RecG [Candidatus Falkowbacteria bacterium]|jgi:ATP-dependent DNA helicase RecG|nr:ATP-dependent DNA helicase RecG [Candidatus Falkowbacteria bacterium]